METYWMHHLYIYIYIYIYMSDTLSPHVLILIASGWSSLLHPVSSHTYCMYVRAGRLAFAGVHRSTSLMSSSLLFRQCSACLVCLTWIVFVMGGRWPYSGCLVGCCHQDLFNISRNILVQLLSSFYSSIYIYISCHLGQEFVDFTSVEG